MHALLRNLILAGTSVVLVLGLFELGLRAAGYRALYEMYSSPSIFWEYDPVLGWSHEPGARGRYVGPRPWPIEFENDVAINSLGLRGPELGERAPDEVRVLFLGDSQVAAFEVPEADTFVRRLERELGERLQRNVRVVNGGVRGYGADQYLMFYEERARKFGADVVVVFVSGNDFSDDRTLHEARRPFGKPALVPDGKGGMTRVGAPVPHYDACEEVYLSTAFDVVHGDSLPSRVLCHAEMALFDHSSLFTLFTVSVSWNEEVLLRLYNLGNPHGATSQVSPETAVWFAHTRDILLALIADIRRDGATAIVTGGPKELDAYGGKSLPEGGAVTVDLSPMWSKPQEEVRWKHDSHLNPEGHRQVAALLEPALDAALRR